jgi:hypothetical protein
MAKPRRRSQKEARKNRGKRERKRGRRRRESKPLKNDKRKKGQTELTF